VPTETRCLAAGCPRDAEPDWPLCNDHDESLTPDLRRAVRAGVASLVGTGAPFAAAARSLLRACDLHFARSPPCWVVDVKDPDAGSFVWVNRAWNGHAGHPLANPVRLTQGAHDAEKAEALDSYEQWLDALPDKAELLMALYADTLRGLLPLGCACGEWHPGGPPLPCHAVILAGRLNRLHLTGEI
jgi:hypothetical protein